MGYVHQFGVEPLELRPWRKFLREIKLLLKALPEKVTYRYFDEAKYEAAHAESPHGVLGPNADVMSERQEPVALFGRDGTGKPVFSDEEICFNGDAEKGLAYGTFRIRRTGCKDLCKTDHRPYDLAICVTLCSFAHHFPGNAWVDSDGMLSDWEAAFEIYTKVTGRKPPMMEVHVQDIERQVYHDLGRLLRPLMGRVDNAKTFAEGVQRGVERVLRELPQEFEYHLRDQKQKAS